MLLLQVLTVINGIHSLQERAVDLQPHRLQMTTAAEPGPRGLDRALLGPRQSPPPGTCNGAKLLLSSTSGRSAGRCRRTPHSCTQALANNSTAALALIAAPRPPGTHLHTRVVCRQLHGGRHNLVPKVLVDQPRAGQLGGKAVAKHLAKAALVMVEPQRLCESM